MPKPKILVVDDSPEIRLSAVFILEDQGFRCFKHKPSLCPNSLEQKQH